MQLLPIGGLQPPSLVIDSDSVIKSRNEKICSIVGSGSGFIGACFIFYGFASGMDTIKANVLCYGGLTMLILGVYLAIKTYRHP